jgi:hypothetical protein
MNDELGRIWKEAIVPGFCFNGRRKTTDSLNRVRIEEDRKEADAPGPPQNKIEPTEFIE